MLTKAFSPEQAAFGKLENGRDVIILYVKEFSDEVCKVRVSGLTHYTYNWFENEQKDTYVLQITWEIGIHIAIRFNTQHFNLIAQLMEPKDVILVTSPISELMNSAQQHDRDFLEFDDVLTFSGLIFTAPSPLS